MGSTADLQLSATCACGAVEVRLAGPVRSMLLCACQDCQRATGTGHASVAIAERRDVTITGGARSFDFAAASGAIFTRSFCPNCGTPLFGQSSRAPRSVMLPVGLFAGNNAWFSPNQMIFARSHPAWDTVADTLPRHDTYRGRTQN